MEIKLNFILDKSNEAEVAYAKMLDMTFTSLKLMRNFGDTSVPDVNCYILEEDSKLNYTFVVNQNLTVDDIQKLWGEVLKPSVE